MTRDDVRRCGGHADSAEVALSSLPSAPAGQSRPPKRPRRTWVPQRRRRARPSACAQGCTLPAESVAEEEKRRLQARGKRAGLEPDERSDTCLEQRGVLGVTEYAHLRHCHVCHEEDAVVVGERFATPARGDRLGFDKRRSEGRYKTLKVWRDTREAGAHLGS